MPGKYLHFKISTIKIREYILSLVRAASPIICPLPVVMVAPETWISVTESKNIWASGGTRSMNDNPRQLILKANLKPPIANQFDDVPCFAGLNPYCIVKSPYYSKEILVWWFTPISKWDITPLISGQSVLPYL